MASEIIVQDGPEAVIAARGILPLPALLSALGFGQFATGTKTALRKEPCPFCQGKGKFGVFKGKTSGIWLCKCFHDTCRAHHTMDECGFIQLHKGLPEGKDGRRYAFKEWIAMAGVEIKRAVTQPPPPEAPEGDAPKPTEPEPSTITIVGSPVNQPEAKDPDASEIWSVLHSRLVITPADVAMLEKKRGFPARLVEEHGLKSSNELNKRIIEGLLDVFPAHQLLESGIFVRNKNRDARAPRIVPNSQFCGLGITGKKDTNGDPNWAITNPILIPYKDANGHVVWIRPHKGGVSKLDRDDDETCGGHVFSPYLLQTRMKNDGVCVLTESEFKALAICHCNICAIGIPGTSFVRNEIFRKELVELLEKYGVEILVIVFDNELTDDPALPGYKPDPHERYWTPTWAQYIAWDLMKRDPRPACLREVHIGQLPDAWRLDATGKDTGKIDWDTALANFVRKEGPIHGAARAAIEFQQVVDEATTPSEFNELFPDLGQTIISNNLNRLWHVPLLKSGGDREEGLARRFGRLNSRTSHIEIAQWATEMCAALRLCIGTYYTLKEPTDKFKQKLYKVKAVINAEIAALKKQGDERIVDGKESIEDKLDRLAIEARLINEKLRGIPESISNFTLKCEYVLHTIKGTTERLVTMKNTQGEKTSLIPLPGEAHGGLRDFRTWCHSFTQGVADWRGGEKDLQALGADMKHNSAYRKIFEIPHTGYHPLTKVWFAGDRCWTPEGATILPDANNIFWYGGVGYLIETNSVEAGEGFQQGLPNFSDRRGDKDISLKQLFQSFSDGMLANVGDYDGLLAIGMSVLYAAGPEIYRDRGGHPGLWLYGKRGGGKTTIARWLMKIHGFKDDLGGIRIDRGTTQVGMNRALTQYSFQPVWFDEYRRNIPDVEQKESVLRGAFDRSSTAKGMMTGNNRTNVTRILTMPIVSGESSSGDSATRSRYVHVLVAKSRREHQDDAGNTIVLNKLIADSRHLHLIGRYLMENRTAFTEATASFLDSWMTSRSDIGDERTRFVHGSGYAAYMALAEALDITVDPLAFADAVALHANKAFDEVSDETMVNKFWADVTTAVSRGEISSQFFQERDIVCTRNSRGMLTHTPGASTELEGGVLVKAIFIASREVFDLYAMEIRKKGETSPLSRNDIHREISKEKWFIAPGAAPGLKAQHRFRSNTHRYTQVWVVDLENFPGADDLAAALGIEEK